jgi:hypothetical protein
MVIVEPGRHHGSDADERDDAIRVRMASLIALPPRKYPNIVDSAPSLAECASPDAYYNLGIDMLLAGLGGVAKGLARQSVPGSRTGHREISCCGGWFAIMSRRVGKEAMVA